MIIKVDDQVILELSDIKKLVIQNDINADDFVDDMCRRLCYIIQNKYEDSFRRLKAEWDEKLPLNGVEMVPTDPDEYAELVFTQVNYADRKARDEE
jgi:hypothetical protein